jgi:hypothetical protein
VSITHHYIWIVPALQAVSVGPVAAFE